MYSYYLYYFLFTEKQLYWADRMVPPNPSRLQNALPLMLPRFELQNDAYSVHSTAYALMSLVRHGGQRYDLMSTVTWLNNMRNYIGGFASTQVSGKGYLAN